MRLRFSILLAAAVVTLGACSKSESELRQEDRAKIELIITEDVRASKAMAEADESARHNNVPGALDAIDQRARPAIEAGLRASTTAEPKTEWGRAKRDVFAKLLTDRKTELGPYAEAVKSGDPQKLIDSMEAQAKIERRAIAAVADARANQ